MRWMTRVVLLSERASELEYAPRFAISTLHGVCGYVCVFAMSVVSRRRSIVVDAVVAVYYCETPSPHEPRLEPTGSPVDLHTCYVARRSGSNGRKQEDALVIEGRGDGLPDIP